MCETYSRRQPGLVDFVTQGIPWEWNSSWNVERTFVPLRPCGVHHPGLGCWGSLWPCPTSSRVESTLVALNQPLLLQLPCISPSICIPPFLHLCFIPNLCPVVNYTFPTGLAFFTPVWYLTDYGCWGFADLVISHFWKIPSWPFNYLWDLAISPLTGE